MNPLDLRDSIAATMKHARGAVPGIALASSLLCPSVLSAPANRDPAFSDARRIGSVPDDVWSSAWALEPRGDDEFLVAGGAYQIDGDCDYDCRYYTRDFDITTFGFLARVSGTGVPLEPSEISASLAGTLVFDVALQPDGRVIGVGRTGQASLSKLTIFRLEPDGSPDVSFGDGGFVYFVSDPTLHHAAKAVTLESDGRIVVAGYRGNNEHELVVLRLLADGALDESFGKSGVFVGSRDLAADQDIRIVRTSNGRYRVLSNNFAPSKSLECRLLSLTASGTVAGVSRPLGSSSTLESCSSIIVQPDGRSLVAGNVDGEDGHAVVVRLLQSGDRDTSFATDGLPSEMQVPNALSLTPDGYVLVAGSVNGISGTTVARLQASGEIDALYGDHGAALVDLKPGTDTYQVVNDMYPLLDGSALLAGSVDGEPFVVRLLTNGAIDPPVSTNPPDPPPTPEPPPPSEPPPSEPPQTSAPPPVTPAPSSSSSMSGGGEVGLESLLLVGLAGLLRRFPPWTDRLRRFSGKKGVQTSTGDPRG